MLKFKRKPRLGRILETHKVFLLHLGKKRRYRQAVRLTASFVLMAFGLR